MQAKKAMAGTIHKILSATACCILFGASGTGMAAGTTLPGLFSIDHNLQVLGGNVSADCPTGSICQELPGTGDGLLVRSVENIASGAYYIQSIVAEELAGGGLYANEQVVLQGVSGEQNAANIAQKMVIDDVANGFHANHTLVDALVGQNLNGVPYYTLNQSIDLGNGALSKVRIRGSINAAFGDVTDVLFNLGQQIKGRSVYIDQLGGPNERELGDFVFRSERTMLATQNLTLDNTLGSVNTGAAGSNRVGAVFINQAVAGMDNDFGLLKYGTAVGLIGASTGTWTPSLVSIDVLSGNPSSDVASLDPAEAFGTWGTGSVAELVFGVLGDTSDFSIQAFLP